MEKLFIISSLMLLVSCEDDCGCVTPPKVTQYQNVIVELNDEKGNDVLDALEGKDELYNNLSLWVFNNKYTASNFLKDLDGFNQWVYLKSRNSSEFTDKSYIGLPRGEKVDGNKMEFKTAIHYNNLFKNDTIEVFYKPERNFEKKVNKITVNGSSIKMDSIVVNDYSTIKKIRLIK